MTERFIAQTNIARFERELAAQHDEGERRILSELLDDERAKLADLMTGAPKRKPDADGKAD